MTWPTWAVSLWGAAWVLLGLVLERRRARRQLRLALHRACDRLGRDHRDAPCEFEFCYLRYTFVGGGPERCIEGMEDWQPLSSERRADVVAWAQIGVLAPEEAERLLARPPWWRRWLRRMSWRS